MTAPPPTSTDLELGPEAVVPSRAAREALETVREALAEERGTVVLLGPAGWGKTWLMREMAWELSGEFQPVTVVADMPAGELCAWALGLLRAPVGGDPQRALLERARAIQAAGSRLVLLIDNAHTLPAATGRRLCQLVERAGGGLSLVLAVEDAVAAARLDGMLGPGLATITLGAALTRSECEALVHALLVQARANPSTRALFDAETQGQLFETSRGLPGRVQELVAQLLQGTYEPPAPPNWRHAPPPHWRHAPPPRRRATGGAGRRWRQFAGAAVLLLGVTAAFEPSLRSRLAPPVPLGTPGDVSSPPPSGEALISVNIKAKPLAQVTLDGVELGVAPLGNVSMLPGRHRIQALMADGRRVEREVFVDEENRHIVIGTDAAPPVKPTPDAGES